MRTLTCFLALGAITSLAWAQAPTTAPANSQSDAGTASKATSKTDRRPESQTQTTRDNKRTTTLKPKTAPRPGRDIREILNSRVPEVNFDRAPLESVMEWVQETSGVLVYVRYAVLEEFGIHRDTPITVRARNQKLSQILWVVMNEAAGPTGVTLAYEASSELLLLSTHADLSRKLVTRVYQVSDIIHDVPYFWYDPNQPFGEGAEGRVFRTKVERIGNRSAESSGHEVSDGDHTPPTRVVSTDDEKLLEFAELIMNTIEPETWAINGFGGNGTIFPYKGKLIIRNSLHVHKLIGEARKR